MRPPPFDELAKKVVQTLVTPERIASGSGLNLNLSDSEYRHWDELRHRKPPNELTLEQWWFLIKVGRMTTYRKLPLRDKTGMPFVYSLPDQVLSETDFVNTNAKGRIALSEEVTNPATRDQYLVSSLIEEAVTSSQLEGARTDRQVARELIRSGREPRDRDERMILNNYYAMERVGGLRDKPLTIDMICEIHRIVTEGTLENPDSAGRFQLDTEERVGVYDYNERLLFSPPPAKEIEARMRELCEFANESDPKHYLPGVLRALTIHFMIGYIHPFEDGNGRTARILFYWSMLNQGYWLTEFVSVSSLLKKAPARYGRSFLYTETDDNDLTYFHLYHLGILHRAIDTLNGYLARKMAEAKEVREMLASESARFSARQIALLRNALSNPTATYSVQSHMRSHRIAMETARKDLSELEKIGLLNKHRVGKRHVYAPVPDLADVLKRVPHVGM